MIKTCPCQYFKKEFVAKIVKYMFIVISLLKNGMRIFLYGLYVTDGKAGWKQKITQVVLFLNDQNLSLSIL